VRSLIVSDIFFKLNLVRDCFSFLSEYFECIYGYDFIVEENKNTDLLIGWGSGCFKIFENLELFNSTAIVLISPYLDFDRFFSWIDSCENYEKTYFERSGVTNTSYYNFNVDLSVLKGRKIFLKENIDIKNFNIFIGGEDKLINPEDSLKLDFFFKSSSIHYLDDMGFAPFYENNDIFMKIFKEYIINEYFRPTS
jgi:hypothetical protein